MTFEEFFKKKKISLPLLESGEPALFAEFEKHYNQMGAKSFDHTKKYWFNQLRRRFPLPPEIKTEKIHIENKLAEQTIAESLTEPSAPAIGFKSRFKAGVANAAPAEKAEDKVEVSNDKPAEDTPAPSVGFKPRFKASMVPKPAEQPVEPAEEKPGEVIPPAPSVGFKPRFKASAPPKQVTENSSTSTEPESDPAEAAPPPPVGFKPRFKAAMVQKPIEEQNDIIDEKANEPAPPAPVAEEPSAPVEPEVKPEEINTEPSADEAPKPVGFKPRFNMNKMKPKE